MGLTGWYVSQTQEQTDGQELTVVTSFYPMYIAAENVIGDADGVRLENLSEPQTGCLHDFQLTPEDMKLLSTADVFIINGGGIESFMKEVAEAYPNLKIIEACENISLLSGEEDDTHHHEGETEEEHAHGDVNAHAWMRHRYRRLPMDYLEQIRKEAVPIRMGQRHIWKNWTD